MSVVTESDALHQRVRAFASVPALRRPGVFEALALEIAAFQARWSPGFRRLLAETGAGLGRLEDVPAVPSEAFRLSRVAVHPPELDEVRFETSGTTGTDPGVHVMRTTATYRHLSVSFGERALVPGGVTRQVVVALAPPPGCAPQSSLGFMMGTFMRAMDGRSLDRDASPDRFAVDRERRWLLRDGSVDSPKLREAAAIARARGEPLLVLATAFACVALLDALSGSVVLPGGMPPATVMLTGGFKGRTREVDESELRSALASAFATAPAHIVGEYGMTELTSQLFEGVLPGAPLRGPPGAFVEPPWLRIVPVHPVSLEPVPLGEVGLARIIDLGNVDSAVVVLAQDLVRRTEDGCVELHGRRQGAPARGCSLAMEVIARCGD